MQPITITLTFDPITKKIDINGPIDNDVVMEFVLRKALWNLESYWFGKKSNIEVASGPIALSGM